VLRLCYEHDVRLSSVCLSGSATLVDCDDTVQQNAEMGQGRSDGGYIGIYTPKNQSTLQFICGYWLFFFPL